MGIGNNSPDHCAAWYVKIPTLNCSIKRTIYGTTYVTGETNSLNLQ